MLHGIRVGIIFVLCNCEFPLGVNERLHLNIIAKGVPYEAINLFLIEDGALLSYRYLVDLNLDLTVLFLMNFNA